jgi:hypothetical protein
MNEIKFASIMILVYLFVLGLFTYAVSRALVAFLSLFS